MVSGGPRGFKGAAQSPRVFLGEFVENGDFLYYWGRARVTFASIYQGHPKGYEHYGVFVVRNQLPA